MVFGSPLLLVPKTRKKKKNQNLVYKNIRIWAIYKGTQAQKAKKGV